MKNYSNDTPHTPLLHPVHAKLPYGLRWPNHASVLVEKEVFKAKRVNLFDSRYSVI